MTTKIQRQRIQQFNAWKSALSLMRKTRARHPLHDPDDYRREKPEHHQDSDVSEFEEEIAAWDEASDEDFAKFEESLE